ncbi:MAG: Hsp20/alpha crystallin family protein [Pyrinomonadaceae bacterium]|nr:Hsp20/alpha crystallin family protein [Phycisphaerales bacterium]
MTQPNESTSTVTPGADASDATSTCECAAESTTSSATVFHPGVDVIETGQEYLIHADVPGATPDGIDIQFHDGVLKMRAGIQPRSHAQSRSLVREYGIGDYERAFRVSGHVDADHITAELKHGVLTLRLPKADAVKPRKIAVQSSN